MNFINKLTLSVALVASSSAIAQMSNVALLNDSLKAMQPLSVKDSGSEIYVSLDTASITPEIYDVSIQAICMPVWLKKDKAYLENIKSVYILNKFNYAGYILDDPRSACKKAGDEQPDQSKVTIMSNTRLFTKKGN